MGLTKEFQVFGYELAVFMFLALNLLFSLTRSLLMVPLSI